MDAAVSGPRWVWSLQRVGLVSRCSPKPEQFASPLLEMKQRSRAGYGVALLCALWLVVRWSADNAWRLTFVGHAPVCAKATHAIQARAGAVGSRWWCCEQGERDDIESKLREAFANNMQRDDCHCWPFGRLTKFRY